MTNYNRHSLAPSDRVYLQARLQSVGWNNRQSVDKHYACKNFHNFDRVARTPEKQRIVKQAVWHLAHRWIVLCRTFAVFDASVSKEISKPTEDIQHDVIQIGPKGLGEGGVFIDFTEWRMLRYWGSIAFEVRR